MTEFEISESMICALDSLGLAMDSLNDIEDVEFGRILGLIEAAYDELLLIYNRKEEK